MLFLTSKPVAPPGHDSVDFFGAPPVFFEDRPGSIEGLPARV